MWSSFRGAMKIGMLVERNSEASHCICAGLTVCRLNRLPAQAITSSDCLRACLSMWTKARRPASRRDFAMARDAHSYGRSSCKSEKRSTRSRASCRERAVVGVGKSCATRITSRFCACRPQRVRLSSRWDGLAGSCGSLCSLEVSLPFQIDADRVKWKVADVLESPAEVADVSGDAVFDFDEGKKVRIWLVTTDPQLNTSNLRSG